MVLLLLLSTCRYNAVLKPPGPQTLEQLLVVHFPNLVRVVLKSGADGPLHVLEPVLSEPEVLEEMLEEAQSKLKGVSGSSQGTKITPVRVRLLEGERWGWEAMVPMVGWR
jgi:hypothetical protein